jgi:dihydrofolate synthase/folylpolyglutamate synthase
MTYEEALYDIENTPKFATESGVLRGKSGNDNLRAVMDILDNPQDKIRSIHIAGTNGKGSTAVFTADILRGLGYRVGLFTSPHLVRINERIKTDDVEISDDDFADCYNAVRVAIRENESNGGCALSYFEMLFAMAAVYFCKNRVDFVVYETGLGGRLDATNILKPMVTAITSIGMDHMKYLGDTITKIAGEKAGIIKKGIPVVYNTGSVEADMVIESRADELEAMMINVAKTDYMINDFTDNGIDFSISNSYYSYQGLRLAGVRALYQIDNAATAIEICNVLLLRLGRERLEEEDVRRGLEMFSWPGRMEKLQPGVIIDGAHNSDAIHRFVESVEELEKGKSISLLFAVAEDKDYEPMIEELVGRLDIGYVCVTSLNSERGISAGYIAKIFEYYLKKKAKAAGTDAESFEVFAEDDIKKALESSIAAADGRTLYCVGSLYLAGSLKAVNDMYVEETYD